MSNTYVSPRWVRGPEQAKLIRAALRAKFPETKFSVRCSRGSAIDIRWTDGPTGNAVDAVAQKFAGGDFDGMIDLRTSSQHWLNPDGTVSIAHAEGTERSRGYLPERIGDPQHPSAELVRFAQDFVFTHREYSERWEQQLQHEVMEFCGMESWEPSASVQASTWVDRETGGVGMASGSSGWGDWPSTLVHQLAAQRDRYTACDHGTGTYPMGNGWHRCKGCGLRCKTPKAWRGR